MAAFCEHGDESSASKQARSYIVCYHEQVSYCQLVIEGLISRSSLDLSRDIVLFASTLL
jgi:hypothetical protein